MSDTGGTGGMFDPRRLQRPTSAVDEPEDYPLPVEVGEFHIDAPSRIEQIRIAALDVALRASSLSGGHALYAYLEDAEVIEAWITRPEPTA